MIKRNKARYGKTARTKQKTGGRRLGLCALMLVCGLTLVSGFFFAARQHFFSMDYGMKNSRLRRQIDELESEKRRLLLAREISLSPTEIKKAVRKQGLINEPTAEVAQVASVTKDKAIPPTPVQAKPMIIKTSSVSVAGRSPDVYPKTTKLIAAARMATRVE